MPRSESARAARIPPTPAPTTSALGTVSSRMSVSGIPSLVRATPALTRLVAFSVAASRSCRCAQEHCSRTLTCVYMYGLIPALCAIARKVVRWSFGEQDAITMPSRPFSWTVWIISCWAASEQAKRNVFATATPGSFSAAARTFSSSTKSEMFPPQ